MNNGFISMPFLELLAPTPGLSGIPAPRKIAPKKAGA
jgi:hypothetical protein